MSRLAVIGAGWAGLSAALCLKKRGHAVHVYEAARTPGGRARRVASSPLSCDLDNGQHILLGAYTATLQQMQALGLNPETLFHRERLALMSADGTFCLRAGHLPAPLHLLAGMLRMHGLRWSERLGLIRVLSRLQRQRWRTTPGLTVGKWLVQERQNSRVIRMFWQPLCLAALNTPLEEACAQLFANVLRDSVGGSARHCDILIPTVDLSRIWPERAIAMLQDETWPSTQSAASHPHGLEASHLPDRTAVCLGQAVRTLQSGPDRVLVNGQPYDGAILATNTPSAHRLLAQLAPAPGSSQFLTALSAFEFIPIATLTLRLERPWGQPHAMQMLWDDPGRLQFGQWLFDRSALVPQPAPPTEGPAHAQASHLIHVVISDAGGMAASNADQLTAAIITQLQEQAGRHKPMPAVTGHHLIVEKRATFKAAPGMWRPGNQTPWPSIWVAGDWTDTGYPGVLEGAVRSGQRAAALAAG